jgi:hypothetical protein
VDFEQSTSWDSDLTETSPGIHPVALDTTRSPTPASGKVSENSLSFSGIDAEDILRRN